VKIGAGGLQSLLAHDNITTKQIEPGRGRVIPDNQQMQNNNLAQKPINLSDIFKAVDRLNKAAQMFNHPLQFKVIKDRDGRRKVRVRNLKDGKSQIMEPEQLLQQLSRRQQTTKGNKFDDYV